MGKGILVLFPALALACMSATNVFAQVTAAATLQGTADGQDGGGFSGRGWDHQQQVDLFAVRGKIQ